MTIQNTESSWEQLLEVARNNTSARWVHRPRQSPSTARIPSILHLLSADMAPPIVLHRDANSGCPFCERVWFALEEKRILFATEFIDLFNKLKWDINTALNAYETRRIPQTNVIYDRSATEGRNSYQTASESTFAKMIKPSQMSQDDFEA